MQLSDPTLFGAITDHLPVGIAVVRAPGGELLYGNATLEALFAGLDVAAVVRGEGAIFQAKNRPGAAYPASEMPLALVVREKTETAVD